MWLLDGNMAVHGNTEFHFSPNYNRIPLFTELQPNYTFHRITTEFHIKMIVGID
ncbi:hypothetical protein DPMN_149841 [Dreissena polymorpha]|uniref:Uncharacterized protein n=1 Tax=Dreissena polymorpha TaxID=45954 RepID=A0A9D4FF72_DREPO|nr:hypothetical protein DPMN_149841 [Dreissena polymorpha]